jgi:hypothetical protein
MLGRITVLLVALVALTACDNDSKPAAAKLPTTCGTYDGEGCAPSQARVDLEPPTFSNPTEITNPLYPISRLRSALLLGHVDGKPFRTETTLLPGTETIVWNGEKIDVRVSQYLAYLDGRIAEVALDRFAQADDGSVWYFGEDVFDYESGTVAATEGTWLAGREGPPAMIMPPDPKVGDVYRPENAVGVVFEEVTVKQTGETVTGPLGPVEGVVVVDELHADGAHEEKTFAPGYGEFRTGGGGDLEALALAVPTDKAKEPMPSELSLLESGAVGVVELLRVDDPEAATAVTRRMNTAWATLQQRRLPRMVAERLDTRLAALTKAVQSRKRRAATQAALDVAQSVLDLQLRYRPAAVVDRERFHLWTQQLRVHAAEGDRARVNGAVAALEWIRDRFAPGRREVDARLWALRIASDTGNLASAADHAARLGAYVRNLRSG